jgi:MOSC domain-containing protein YiiM
MMINLDPNTAIQHPEVLRAVTRAHNVQVGIYANVIVPGIVAVGDEISLSS